MPFPWFRMYHESRNDRKLDTLADDEFRVWHRLLCLASESKDRGIVGCDDPAILAIEVARGDEELLARTVKRLVALRIVADNGETIAFLNFARRNYDKPSDAPQETAKRKRQQRDRGRDDTGHARDNGVTDALSRAVTPGHATEETRLEERRGDQTRGEGRVASEASPSPENRPPAPAPRTRASGATHAPADFVVTEAMRAWAAEFAPDADVDQQTARFIAKARESRKTSHDWHASWEAWMTSPYAASKPESPPRGGHDPTARPSKNQQSLAAIANFDPTRRHT